MLTSFGQNAILVKHFPKKKSFGRNPKIDYFPPTTKPHPLNSLTVGPPPLYWLGTSWWYSGPCVLDPLSSVFVFFRSTSFPPWQTSLVVLLHASCLSFVERGVWALSLFLLIPLWACVACQTGSLGLCSLFLFLHNLLVCKLLLLLDLLPWSWAFRPIGLHSFLHGSFTSLLSFIVPIGPLVVTSCHVGPLCFYLFS